MIKTVVWEYTADSLGDYNNAISSIWKSECAEDQRCVLWYRGHSFDHGYKLIPTLFRNNKSKDFNGNTSGTYSRNHLSEEYRFQHFRAKGLHLLSAHIDNSLEWKEVMQHHSVNSRLMDWSESSNSALLFALEDYFKPKEDLELSHKRRIMSPVVWVLNPIRLNKSVVSELISTILNNNGKTVFPYIEQALELIGGGSLADKIGNELTKNISTYSNMKQVNQTNSWSNIDGIVCLSAIMELIKEKGVMLKNAIESFELNPLFYLLSRFYSDGLIVKGCILPPLAIVHPYHSSRIQAQHGVFTVFPHYEMDEYESALYENTNMAFDPRSMENMALSSKCLYKIRLTRPAQIARELFILGEREANLYPELQYFAQDIEAQKYYF